MRTDKPFWKEPSLKHVWNRLNDGAKVMLYGVLFIVVCGLLAIFGNEVFGVSLLLWGLGFCFGWIFHDLNKPVWKKNDETGEYQRIEFGDDE